MLYSFQINPNRVYQTLLQFKMITDYLIAFGWAIKIWFEFLEAWVRISVKLTRIDKFFFNFVNSEDLLNSLNSFIKPGKTYVILWKAKRHNNVYNEFDMRKNYVMYLDLCLPLIRNIDVKTQFNKRRYISSRNSYFIWHFLLASGSLTPNKVTVLMWLY